MNHLPHTSIKQQSGFTLVETLIAILILTLTIGALLTLTAGGFFSIRYAKNDIVATNLLQESLEYIRNTRDTAAQQNISWDSWITTYRDMGCFGDGCTINPYAVDASVAVNPCGRECEHVDYFPDAGYYAYEGLGGNLFDAPGGNVNVVPTSFVRTVTMKLETPSDSPDPQLIVTARMDWLNGTNPKHAQQSIVITKWNLQ